MNTRLHSLAPLAVALAGVLVLGACGRQDQTASQKVDATVAKVEQKSEAAAQDIKQAAGAAGDKVATVARDAAITAQINAELTKDPALSALKANVDTTEGHVVLHGTAPDASARDRATRIAANVKGVSSVENVMALDGKS